MQVRQHRPIYVNDKMRVIDITQNVTLQTLEYVIMNVSRWKIKGMLLASCVFLDSEFNWL